MDFDCGGKVVKSSSSLEKLPTKKEVYRIAKERGFAPFLYLKDLLIEESEVTLGNSSWSRLSMDDYYPTIEFYIGRPEWQDTKVVLSGKQLIADFDTGCPAVLVNEKEIDENVLGGFEFEATGKHLSRCYDYRVCNARLAVLTKEGKVKARSFLIRVVHNRQESPFCSINPARKALVGRELVLRLLLNILLKADEKETEILK
jgi:hypothetical protein